MYFNREFRTKNLSKIIPRCTRSNSYVLEFWNINISRYVSNKTHYSFLFYVIFCLHLIYVSQFPLLHFCQRFHFVLEFNDEWDFSRSKLFYFLFNEKFKCFHYEITEKNYLAKLRFVSLVMNTWKVFGYSSWRGDTKRRFPVNSYDIWICIML